jgi:hypothetical protein
VTAALLALASALSYAAATVVGHRAATTSLAGTGRVGSPVVQLVRHPGFLIGQVLGIVGLALHAAALASGLVVVVQPVLCVGLVLALALGAVVDARYPGRPLPRRPQWIAAGTVVLGLVVFLAAAAPTAGTGQARAWALPAAVAVFALGALVVVLAARRGLVRRRAAALGACAGVAFGLTGVLVKAVVALPLTEWVTSWPTYALLGVGATGTALAQWAYSAGPLVKSQPVASALEPVVAVVLAGPVFAEGLAGGVPAHLGQAVGLALLVVGVLVVGRSDHPDPVREQRSSVEVVPDG